MVDRQQPASNETPERATNIQPNAVALGSVPTEKERATNLKIHGVHLITTVLTEKSLWPPYLLNPLQTDEVFVDLQLGF